MVVRDGKVGGFALIRCKLEDHAVIGDDVGVYKTPVVIERRVRAILDIEVGRSGGIYCPPATRFKEVSLGLHLSKAYMPGNRVNIPHR